MMIDSSLDASVRSFAAERKYGHATLQRWSRLGPDDAGALLALAQELRPSENQLRDLWDWTEEIAARDHLGLAQVLAAEPVTAARRRAVSRNDKLKLVKGALRRRRFPQLAAAEERLAALVRELALPPSIRVTFPEFLEGDAVRVEITADSAAAFRRAAEALQAASATPACEQIFAVLAEAG
jgi:ribonuclease D